MIRKNDALGLCLNKFTQNNKTHVRFKAIWQEQKIGSMPTPPVRRNTAPRGDFRGISAVSPTF